MRPRSPCVTASDAWSSKPAPAQCIHNHVQAPSSAVARSFACRRRVRGRCHARCPALLPGPSARARGPPTSRRQRVRPAFRHRRPGGSGRHPAPWRARPAASASGLPCMAAGTLPDAPLMRPSVTSATLKPLPWSTASGGVSLCSSGMPFARGPWNRTTATKSRSSRPALKACCNPSWLSKTSAGASMTCRSSRHRGHLDHRAAQIAGEQPQAAGRAERLAPRGARRRRRRFACGNGRHDDALALLAREPACRRACRPRTPSSRRCAGTRASSSSRSTKPGPPAAWNWFTSALPFG